MFQLVSPQGRSSFDPRGIISTNLVKVHKEMLNLLVSEKKNSEVLPSLFPWASAGASASFDFRGIICKNMVVVPIFQLVTPRVGQVLTPEALHEKIW